MTPQIKLATGQSTGQKTSEDVKTNKSVTLFNFELCKTKFFLFFFFCKTKDAKPAFKAFLLATKN